MDKIIDMVVEIDQDIMLLCLGLLIGVVAGFWGGFKAGKKRKYDDFIND